MMLSVFVVSTLFLASAAAAVAVLDLLAGVSPLNDPVFVFSVSILLLNATTYYGLKR